MARSANPRGFSSIGDSQHGGEKGKKRKQGGGEDGMKVTCLACVWSQKSGEEKKKGKS